jgi:hypothetical protein
MSILLENKKEDKILKKQLQLDEIKAKYAESLSAYEKANTTYNNSLSKKKLEYEDINELRKRIRGIGMTYTQYFLEPNSVIQDVILAGLEAINIITAKYNFKKEHNGKEFDFVGKMPEEYQREHPEEAKLIKDALSAETKIKTLGVKIKLLSAKIKEKEKSLKALTSKVK